MRQLMELIKNELVNNKEVKTVSFDVFDSILFRSVVTPDKVFWRMYQKKRNIFPSFTSMGDWVNSRKNAEKEARRTLKEKYGHEEVTLTDIYQHLPTVYSNHEELMQLEIDSECEIGVLNTEIVEIIQYLYMDCNKDILFVSDMYLDAGQIGYILKKCGLDLSLIKKIYVSSEAKCCKRNGKLFQLVLNDQKLLPGELLHVGDNLQRDILAAKQLGIHVCYYNFIPEHRFRNPFILWEQEIYDTPLCEKLYLTRLLTENHNQEIGEKNQFFFTLGSMIIGPFLTFAIEWVVETALKEKVYKIRPFMREGRFLTDMILLAAEDRGIKLSVEPLYISRMAAYISRFGEITAGEISLLMTGAGVIPQDIFRLLQIPDLVHDFQKYKDIPFTELKSLYAADGNSIYSTIYNYLSSSEILDIIHKRNYDKKHIFMDYLQQMGLMEPVITLDIGWNGTTMNAVYKAVRERKPEARLIQLLLCSSKNVAKNSVDGCVIKGFAGNYGSLQGKFNHIFRPIFELFCLCDEGPTIGYKYDSSKVVPVTDKNIYSAQWLSNIKAVQRGVMAFQKEYFKMRQYKEIKIDLKAQGNQALSMIERLFSYPLLQEAEWLRSAELDQNLGIENRIIPVLEEKLCLQYKELGTEQFYKYFRNVKQSVTWQPALTALNSPLAYLKTFYLQKAKYERLSALLLVEHAVKEAGEGKITIAIDGRTLTTDLAMIYFKAMGALGKISGIVSINEYMRDVIYNGILITSMHNKTEGLYFIPVREKRAYSLLRKQIVEEKGNQIKIIGFYENNLEVLNYER